MYRLYCILSILSIIMINQKENKGKQNLGSSLSLPAHGRAGARATPFLAAHFAKQNTNLVGTKSEGGAEGGRSDSDESSDSKRCGGNSAAPEHKIEVSPAACSFRN